MTCKVFCPVIIEGAVVDYHPSFENIKSRYFYLQLEKAKSVNISCSVLLDCLKTMRKQFFYLFQISPKNVQQLYIYYRYIFVSQIHFKIKAEHYNFILPTHPVDQSVPVLLLVHQIVLYLVSEFIVNTQWNIFCLSNILCEQIFYYSNSMYININPCALDISISLFHSSYILLFSKYNITQNLYLVY